MRKKTTEEFIFESIIIHGSKYEYKESVYVNNTSKVKIKCNIHGPFYQSPKLHKSGSGCPKCANVNISNKMKDNFKNGITHGWSHINSDKSRRSYPEKFFYNVFMENKMYEKYTILEKHPYGKYFIDFLFVEIKLIVEIDGSQHYRNQEAILHDSIRDEYFKNEGFKIYRIKWSDVCMDPRGEISCLIEFIKDNKNRESRTYTLEECKKIPKKRKKIRNKKCTNCNSLIGRENNLCRECWKITIKKSSKKKRIPKRKNNCIHCDSPIYGKNYCRKCYNKSQFRSERPKYRDLLLEISESGYVKVSKKYGVSDNAIRKWIRSYEKE